MYLNSFNSPDNSEMNKLRYGQVKSFAKVTQLGSETDRIQIQSLYS